MIKDILNKSELSKEDIILLLKTQGKDSDLLFEHSAKIKEKSIGNLVYLRGLIEYSNVCAKDCFYCGIRKSNHNIEKYTVQKEEILQAIKYAYDNNFASIAIQSGELSNRSFVNNITNILKDSQKITNGNLGITLSCGEQSEETYQTWFDNGADRYLLRIESSNKELYYKIHPKDETHKFENRINALKILRKVGYQVGTGVMIGLPFQTYNDLADDLLFMKKIDIDMCGMGPYIEHNDTPMYKYNNLLMPIEDRYYLSLKMISILRILMKDINIAATTALQSIKKDGREKAILVGANVLMPNITPNTYRDNYALYKNKPKTKRKPEEFPNHKIAYSQQGTSKHFTLRKTSK